MKIFMNGFNIFLSTIFKNMSFQDVAGKREFFLRSSKSWSILSISSVGQFKVMLQNSVLSNVNSLNFHGLTVNSEVLTRKKCVRRNYVRMK